MWIPSMMRHPKTWTIFAVFRYVINLFRQRYLMVTLFLFVITSKYFLMLINGQTFIPTWVYDHLTPWQTEIKAPWNVLSADGIFEFLPWRKVVMEATANGLLPIVNPYAASTLGGQPLLANGQSGFFYPLHWPFWILPSALAPTTMMVSIAFHMGILALGTYQLARRLSASHVGAAIAAIGFSQSATLVTWLPLATHLTVLAWLPWMWLAALNKSYKHLLLLTMMSLLAGHLQLAVYSLLTTGIFIVSTKKPLLQSGRLLTALFLGLCLSACQLMPSIELGQQSHRGGVAASPAGYAAYISNAMPVSHLITWLSPNHYGNPNTNGGTNWLLTNSGVPNNYAEWALYTGVLIPVLFFAGMFTFKTLRRDHKVIAVIGVLALAIAVGSPLCAAMYYGIPGFAATGNPARVLPVLSLAISLLAGIAVSRVRLRHLTLGTFVLLVIAGSCMALADQTIQKLSLPRDVTSAISAYAILNQIPMIGLSIVVCVVCVRLRSRYPIAIWVLPALLLADLWTWSASYHPAGRVADAIKTTPGLDFLKLNAAKSPIACLVGNWSISSTSPKGATLPPNLLTLHQLHDIATYDSLILRKDKETLENLAGTSLMPPENGNLLRVPTVDAATALGAEWLVLPPSTDVPTGWQLAYTGSDMTILRSSTPAAVGLEPRSLVTSSLRLGMFLTILLTAVIVATSSPRFKTKLLSV